MTDLLVRNVPDELLATLRDDAARHGASMQGYLLESLEACGAHARRQLALVRAKEELAGQPPVSEEDRRAVLDVVYAEVEERAAELARGDRA